MLGVVARWDNNDQLIFRAIPMGEGRYYLPGDMTPIACIPGSTKPNDEILTLGLDHLRLERVSGD